MGDSAYPFTRWLQKGFPKSASVAKPRWRTYNARFSATRVVVECAYGKLKGQWRCLRVGLRQRSPEEWNTIVKACVVLHNVAIDEMDQGFTSRFRRFATTPDVGDEDPDYVGRRNVPTTTAPGAIAYRQTLLDRMVPP